MAVSGAGALDAAGAPFVGEMGRFVGFVSFGAGFLFIFVGITHKPTMEETMMKTLLFATAIGCVLAGGCATNPDNIAPTALSPLSYKEYSCGEIAAEINRVAERESELRAILKERADTDAVQMGVATLLFFPTLFWIDGDGPDTLEYARLKGEHEALTEAAASRQCAP